MDFVLNSLINTTTISLLSLTISLCFFLFGFSKTSSKHKEPPTVSGSWPIIGHLPLLNTQAPHKTLGALAEKYGPIFTINIGSKQALVLNNWELAKECFTTNDMSASSRPNLVATETMCYNGAMFGLGPCGDYWRKIRKIVIQQILTNRRVTELGHFRVLEVRTTIKELYDVWCSKRKDQYSNNDDEYVVVEIKQWFKHLAVNMVIQMAIGRRYFGSNSTTAVEKEAQKIVEALKEFMRLFGVFTVGDAIPCLRWFDIGGHEKAMKETFKQLDKILSEWLEDHQHKRSLDGKVDGGQDIMDVLLELLDGTTIEGFDSDTIMKAIILTLFLGGIDTSSVTLTWTLSLLLKNPHIMEKAKEELDTQVGRDRTVSESDISKLVYLQAIVKETLRLYPPGPISAPREFSENCTLGGYHIKKGTRLITNLWKIQTDASVWENPLEFKPERFLTTHKDVDLRGHHFELLPFGSGRRMCPGISFGLQMVHFTLASFLHSFEIVNPVHGVVDMSGTLGLSNTKTTPHEILVKPRLSPSCYEIM